jgi:multidrug resistance efflux pump
MPALKPIPVPQEQKWRLFRMRRLPQIVFGITSIVAAILWRHVVVPDQLVGEIQSVTAAVSSPGTGTLTDIHVARFQLISEGDRIATITTTHPDIVEASLAVINAEIALLQLGIPPSSETKTIALRYEQLRIDWMKERISLASARVDLERAENILRRSKSLYDGLVTSIDDIESSEAARNSLQAEITERENLVSVIEERLTSLKPKEASEQDSLQDEDRGDLSATSKASIAVQEQRLRLAEAQLKPINVTAPISGQVSLVHKRAGEFISQGDPIVTIASDQAEHILTYLPAPISFEPTPGTKVEVRTRDQNRRVAIAQIVNVGVQLEPITNQVIHPHPHFLKGLPIIVSLPPDLQSRPGAAVDLRVLQ